MGRSPPLTVSQPTLTVSQPTQRLGTIATKTSVPLICSPIEEKLSQLPKLAETLSSLNLDMSLISRLALHRQTPVGGRLAQFSRNWEMLTKDPWILTTVKGYRLPLQQWPSLTQAPVQFSLDSVHAKALATEIQAWSQKAQLLLLTRVRHT